MPTHNLCQLRETVVVDISLFHGSVFTPKDCWGRSLQSHIWFIPCDCPEVHSLVVNFDSIKGVGSLSCVHPQIAWAKLRAIREGAAIA